jgi:hypothetical protein
MNLMDFDLWSGVEIETAFCIMIVSRGQVLLRVGRSILEMRRS